MFKRVMVGVIGIPLLVLVLSFAPAWATMLLMMALCGVGAHELLHAVGAAGDRTLCVLTEGSAALVPLAVFGESFYSVMPLSLEGEIQAAGFPWGLPILGLALVLGLFLHAILRYGKEGAVPFAHLTAGIFGGIIFPLMLSCLLRLRMGDHGTVMVWLPLAISFGSDTFALFAGMACGKHKLAPHVSPKKTVEGSIGGMFFCGLSCSAFGAVTASLIGNKVGIILVLRMFAVGIIVSVISQLGDLIASVIKRKYGIKDYGKIFPGHGGVLDRFDSVLATSPIILILTLFPEFVALAG